MIRRGQIVIIALQGDYGKPRPAVIVQSDLFSGHPSVVICPLTSLVRSDADSYRVDIQPSAKNGLQTHSQISLDKITAVSASKIGKVIGELEPEALDQVTSSMAVFLGIT